MGTYTVEILLSLDLSVDVTTDDAFMYNEVEVSLGPHIFEAYVTDAMVQECAAF